MNYTAKLTAILIALLCVLTTTNLGFAQRLQIKETADTIVVQQDGAVVLAYNKRSPEIPKGIDPIFRRSGCIHPVCTPEGGTVTTMFPFDHAHQQGVFSAWVKTTFDGRPVDFWNAAKGTGTVSHERVVSVFEQADRVGFEVDLIHRGLVPERVDILRERWRVTVHAMSDQFHCFDLQLTQSALTEKPLVVKQNRYGGIAVRGPTSWLTADDKGAQDRGDHVSLPSGFLNDLGSDRVQGNHQHARWVSLWGELEGKRVSLTMLSHPDNFRAPQATRLHPTKPYFCFSPCVDDDFAIDQDHPYVAKYRFLVTDTMPDKKQIEEQWSAWTGE